MRLTDLEPHWITPGRGSLQGAAFGVICGFTMLCPHCGERAIFAYFDEPIIDPALRASVSPEVFAEWMRGYPDLCRMEGEVRQWHREGDTFETLTLTPSIDASHFGHWHGFVTNGEVA